MKLALPLALALVLVVGFAGPGLAEIVVDYGWEDGEDVLGHFTDPASITATNFTQGMGQEGRVRTGDHSLRLVKHTAYGEPASVNLVYIWNLQPYDHVFVRLWKWAANGSFPLTYTMTHWNDSLPDDPNHVDLLAGGTCHIPNDEGWTDNNWGRVASWGHYGIVFRAELRGHPGDVGWIDDLHVEAPDHAMVMVPALEPVGARSTTLSGVRALFQ